MKILILSDSHHNLPPMETAVLTEKPDQIIHLGDHQSDAEDLERFFPAVPVCSVPGNCDWVTAEPRYKLVTFAGRKLFLTHGHHYGVKAGLAALINTALAAGADAVLFGHTHTPYYAEVNGVPVINPGTIGMGRRTYGVLTIEGGRMSYEQKNV